MRIVAEALARYCGGGGWGVIVVGSVGIVILVP